MYDEVGELAFVSNTLARASSKARLFAARLPAGDAEPEPINPDDEEAELTEADLTAAATVRMLARNTIGRSEMIRRLILHLFVPGDGYLIGLPPGVLDTRGPEDEPPDLGIGPEGNIPLEQLSWHPLSASEVNLSHGKIRLNVGDGSPVELEEDACVVVRVWRPHPRHWWEADSPVRSNLPVLRELVGLTKHVGATIDSRLAGAGLLVIGQSVEVVGSATDPDTGAERPPAPFIDALIDAMVTPIENRDSAASVVPMVIKVPDEVVDKIRHIRFDSPFDEHARALRDEAIRRLALGLDAPPEVLLGLGSANHWSAWQIDEATAKIHIAPVLGLLCDALTTQFLWPALEEASVPNHEDYVVWFDLADLTMRPNRTAEATDGHNMGLLSDVAWRREAGFDEHDAPEVPKDPAVDLVVRIVKDAGPAIAENPAIVGTLLEVFRSLLGGDDITVEDADAPGEPAGSGTGIPDTRDDPPAFGTNGDRLRRGARR